MTVLRPGAVVLAGGRSSRMGRDKNWLDAGGIPLLTHVADTIAGECPMTVVVASPRQSLPPLPRDATRIDDPEDHRGEGPLRGLAHGLRWLSERGAYQALVASGDLALVSPQHIRFIFSMLVDADAVVPEDDDVIPPRWHPLAGAVRVDPAASVVTSLLRTGERRLLAAFEALGARTVGRASLPDPAILSPCNTPEDWKTICDLQGWG